MQVVAKDQRLMAKVQLTFHKFKFLKFTKFKLTLANCGV